MFRKVLVILLIGISILFAQWQNGFVLQGKICTMSDNSPIIENGRILIHDHKIVKILAPGEHLPAGFSNAVIINTDGVIYPGLMDIHNHPAYNMLPVWDVPQKFSKHTQWTGKTSYKKAVSARKNYLWNKKKLYTRIALYAEVKAIAGGTTTLQGLSQNTGGIFGKYMVRNADLKNFGADRIGTSVFQLKPGSEEYQTKINNLQTKWDRLIYHVAEGSSPALRQEFDDLKGFGAQLSKVVCIHGTALNTADFSYMGNRTMNLVWSPLSNLLLYGATTKVATAKAENVLISLAPDWSPSGSKNILWELKVAYLWNKNHLNNTFTPKQLIQMVTVNPAKALNWQDKVGQIREGMFADLIVTSNLTDNSYLNLIHCTEKDIHLVIIDGEPYYGDKDIMKKLKKIGRKYDFETVTKKLPQVKVVDITRDGLYDQTWKSVIQTLKQYMNNDSFPGGPEFPDEIYTAFDPDFFESLWAVEHNLLSVPDLAAFIFPVGNTNQAAKLLKKPWGKLLYKIPASSKVIIVKEASGRRKNWHEVLVKTDQDIVLRGVVHKTFIDIL